MMNTYTVILHGLYGRVIEKHQGKEKNMKVKYSDFDQVPFDQAMEVGDRTMLYGTITSVRTLSSFSEEEPGSSQRIFKVEVPGLLRTSHTGKLLFQENGTLEIRGCRNPEKTNGDIRVRRYGDESWIGAGILFAAGRREFVVNTGSKLVLVGQERLWILKEEYS